MKQYIKKALWIIPFVLLNELKATDYYFNVTGTSASSPGNGSVGANWIYINSRGATASPSNSALASALLLNTNKFYANGQYVDLNGLVIGACSFDNNTTAMGYFLNSGTITISSATVPQLLSNFPASYDLAGTKIIYNSTSPQSLFTFPHNSIDLLNSNKTVPTTGTFTVNGTLTTTGTISVTFDGIFEINGTLNPSSNTTFNIEYGMKIGSSAVFSNPSTTKFNMNFSYEYATRPYYYFVDSRTSKLYPGTWEFKDDGQYYDPITSGDTVIRSAITVGIYDKIIISENVELAGNITINDNIDLSTTGKTITLNGFILTLKGTITNNSTLLNGGKFIGDNNCEFVFSGNNNPIGELVMVSTTDISKTVKSLTITNPIGSGTNTLSLGNWINITGGTSTSGFGTVSVGQNCILNTNGKLILKSNQYGTAMIGNIAGTLQENSTNGNSSNTLLVENYLPYLKSTGTSKGRQYRFLSSPVSGGKFRQWRDSVSGSSTSGGVIPYASARTGKGIQITGASPNSPTDNFDESTTNNPSLFTYNEKNAGSATGIGNNSANEDAGWTAATDGLGTITNGIGYRVLVRGDRKTSLKSGGSSFNPSNTTIQTRGSYVTGTVDVQITNSGTNTNNGINLVGNPFPCAIDWETVHTASSNLDAAYVVWDVENLSYQSYTKGGSGAASRYIAPGQGFLVYCPRVGGSNTTGTISFPQSAKTTASGNGGRFFQEIKSDHLIAVLRMDTTAADKSFIYFKKGATNYYDQFDAGHIQNNHANLASIDSTNTYYNVNCMDTLTGQRIIPLTLYGSPIGNYKMSFQDVNTFRNHDIYLIDNYTKKTTKIDDMSEYDIVINSDKFSYTDGRLFLSFEPKASSSIIKIQKTNSFSIGPNPIKENINISSLNTNVTSVNYEICNINGQLIKAGTLDIKNDNIPTSFLSSGIYFITLTANNETQTIKFIK